MKEFNKLPIFEASVDYYLDNFSKAENMLKRFNIKYTLLDNNIIVFKYNNTTITTIIKEKEILYKINKNIEDKEDIENILTSIFEDIF